MVSSIQLIIKNASYYSNGVFHEGHILVNDGKIIGIKDKEPCHINEATRVIDAQGKKVLPGVVDSHVHFRDPGRVDREDFFTGSRAAVAGGVTTICEMPITYPPVYNLEILEKRIAIAKEKCIMDFAFYGAAGFENRFELQNLVDNGVCAFKTFLHPAPAGREGEFVGLTVNDDGQLFMMMREAAKTGSRFSFHCENYKLIEEMEKYLHEIGNDDYSFHYKSRPNIAETESVATIIEFAKATGAKVEIVHISAPEACELVKKAQQDGVDIIAETCFHYLSFTTEHIDEYGPYAKCNPPLRTPSDVEKLWGYVMDGTITLLGSDHAPFVKDEKEIGVREGIWRAYSGMPAIEVFLPIMLTHVNAGRLSLEKLVQLMSENVCKEFGMFPQKGGIHVGADADFAIVDMDREYAMSIDTMFSKARDINVLFDGYKCKGGVDYTVVRGTIAFENGEVHDELKGYGEFVRGSVKQA